jgi:hypothetical protein
MFEASGDDDSGVDADSDDSADEQFLSLLVVASGLLVVSVVVLEGRAATYGGVAVGIGLVVSAGLLRHRANRETETGAET